MTLAESKQTKMMSITGTIGRCDLTGLWLKVCIHEGIKITHDHGKTRIKYVGEIDKGLHILKEVIEACEATKCHCRLEISHFYE